MKLVNTFVFLAFIAFVATLSFTSHLQTLDVAALRKTELAKHN